MELLLIFHAVDYISAGTVWMLVNCLYDVARGRSLDESYRLQAVRCGMAEDESQTNAIWMNFLYALILWAFAPVRLLLGLLKN